MKRNASSQLRLTLRPRIVWCWVASAVFSAGCASQPACPTVDPQVLARAVADELEARIRAQMAALGEAGGEQEGEGAADAEAGEEDGQGGRVRVDLTGLPSRGASEPTVRIVVFSDFQCPFCSRIEPTFAQLLREFPDDVRVYFAHQPLPFHQAARPAAIAAIEAQAQGGDAKFWEMHDLLFANQRALERADLERYAAQIGLDARRFAIALDQDKHEDVITRDQAQAARVGAEGTPNTFVNGRQLMGAQPYEEFALLVRAEIAEAQRLMQREGISRRGLYEAIMRGARERGSLPEREVEAPTRRPQPDPNAIYDVPVGSSPVRGPAGALVTVVMFSDFQCPFCRRAHATMEELRQRYGNDVRFVFKHNPLPFHEDAGPAAMAAIEARAQRGDAAFWAMHDALFGGSESPDLSRAGLEALARQQRIDLRRLRRALDTDAHQAVIEADQTLARNLGATGTPAFYINGINVRGAQPIERFVEVIDAQLAKARALVAGGTPAARVYETITAGGHDELQMIQGDD